MPPPSSYSVEAGRLKAFEWRSRLAPGGHTCSVAKLQQQPFSGGLKFAAGGCTVTLREVGEYVKVAAEGCAKLCGSQAYLEPLLVDRRGALPPAAARREVARWPGKSSSASRRTRSS